MLDLWYVHAGSELTLGGAFSIGSNTDPLYCGVNLVEHSLKLDKPVVFVSLNYRVNFFGFLASKELAADNAKYEGGVGNYGWSLNHGHAKSQDFGINAEVLNGFKRTLSTLVEILLR